jgi:hypothetical protein
MQKPVLGSQENYYKIINDMKDFIIKYYDRMRDYLLETNAEEADVESMAFEVESLKEEYFNETGQNMATTDSEYEEQNAVWGLFKKFDRLHGENTHFVDRDERSLLAMKIDLGFGIYNPPCPFLEEDFPDIQKKITTYLSQRVKKPEEYDSMPLLTGIPQVQLSQEQMKYIIDNLIHISHSMTDYVDYYDDGSWNWLIDCIFIVQYVFEKAAEITYKVSKGEASDGLAYDIREAFSYFQISVPEKFQMYLDSVVDKLELIVSDTASFIETHNYNLCNKETWFRPIVFNIALDGMLFTLEQKL